MFLRNKMLRLLTILQALLVVSVSAQQAWFDMIAESFDNASFPLHGCFGRDNISPTQGSECGPKHKTCFFGNQICGDEDANNFPYPSESCTCNGSSGSFGTWDCQPQTCPCDDAVLSLVPWTDADGDSCLAYAQNDGFCDKFGRILSNHGLTASLACCACGGGSDDTASVCTDTLVPAATPIPWLDSVGGNCSWYAADPQTRCVDFANEVDYRFDFMPVGEACCACKGIVAAPAATCTDLSNTTWTTSSNRTCAEVTRQDCFYDEESFGIATSEACCKCGLRDDATTTNPTNFFTRPTIPTSIGGCSNTDDDGNDFELCIKLSPNMIDVDAFTAAHDIWSGIIVGDSIDMQYDVLNATSDYVQQPGQQETMTIPDLHNQLCGYQPGFSTTTTLDVCVNQRILREGVVASVATVFGDDFTRFGVVEWNADTIRSVRDNGLLESAVLHQVGNVLGLGMLWESTAPDQVNLDGADCSYTGTKANDVYQDVSGCASSDTLPLFNYPTELSFDYEGGGNWTVPLCGKQLDPECFLREQRVIIDSSDATVSTLTVAMLDDLGYTVDYDQVDAFTKTDLNASCICSADDASVIDSTSDDSPLEPPPLLSLEGRRKIVSYAKEELTRMNEIALSYMMAPDTTNGGVGIAGLTVFYMEEDGTIFTEYVVNGEGEYVLEEYYYYDGFEDYTATTRE